MKKNQIKIDGRDINSDNPPYFIAEISGNHLNSLDRALELVTISKRAGASAVKLQTLDPAKITLDNDDPRFIVNSGPWKGRKLSDIYRETQLPKDWHIKIFNHAKRLGITAFSTPFDHESVDFLEKLGVPAYKVASNEIRDWPLIKKISDTRKPLIISTGTATEEHLMETINFLGDQDFSEAAFLYCISAYPPAYEEMRLRTLFDMNQKIKYEVGLSDHSLTNEAAIASVALGATIIEKHITKSRDDGGSDSHFSLEPNELADLIKSLERTWMAISKPALYPGERDLSKDGIFTRQLWTSNDIEIGDEFSWQNIMSIRAPHNICSISSHRFKEIIGRKSPVKIVKHEMIPVGIIDQH